MGPWVFTRPNDLSIQRRLLVSRNVIHKGFEIVWILNGPLEHFYVRDYRGKNCSRGLYGYNEHIPGVKFIVPTSRTIPQNKNRLK